MVFALAPASTSLTATLRPISYSRRAEKTLKWRTARGPEGRSIESDGKVAELGGRTDALPSRERLLRTLVPFLPRFPTRFAVFFFSLSFLLLPLLSGGATPLGTRVGAPGYWRLSTNVPFRSKP